MCIELGQRVGAESGGRESRGVNKRSTCGGVNKSGGVNKRERENARARESAVWCNLMQRVAV